MYGLDCHGKSLPFRVRSRSRYGRIWVWLASHFANIEILGIQLLQPPWFQSPYDDRIEVKRKEPQASNSGYDGGIQVNERRRGWEVNCFRLARLRELLLISQLHGELLQGHKQFQNLDLIIV